MKSHNENKYLLCNLGVDKPRNSQLTPKKITHFSLESKQNYTWWTLANLLVDIKNFWVGNSFPILLII